MIIWILIEIILLIFIFSAIIFILPIKLRVNLEKSGENEDFYVKIGIAPGISSFQGEVDLFKVYLKGLLPYILLQTETNSTNKIYVEKPWLNLKKLIEVSPPFRTGILLKLFKRIFEMNSRFFKKIVCQRLVWKTSFGFGDPALTALSTGGIWAAKSIFYINLQKNVQVNFQKPIYEVNPVFNKKEFQIAFDCIFTFRFGHIIIAGCKFIAIFLNEYFIQLSVVSRRSSDFK